jgi:hypothetical protein
VGRDPGQFPNAIATMFFYVTEERATAERIIKDVLSPTLNRPEEELGRCLLIGSAQDRAEKLATYGAAGVQRVFCVTRGGRVTLVDDVPGEGRAVGPYVVWHAPGSSHRL